MTNLFSPGNAPKAEEAFAAAAQAIATEAAEARQNLAKDYRKFKNAMPSANFVFKSGEVARFIHGIFLTKNPVHIAELDHEVKLGHPHITVDPTDTVVTDEDLNPEVALRKKHFAEFQAEMSQKRDMGSTDRKSDLNVANSDSVAANTSNGAAALSGVPAGLLSALNTQSSTAGQ